MVDGLRGFKQYFHDFRSKLGYAKIRWIVIVIDSLSRFINGFVRTKHLSQINY